MNKQNKYVLICLLIIGTVLIHISLVFFDIVPSRLSKNISYQNAFLNTLDAHFIEQMIPHHEDAITMAKSAQSRAKHTEIKGLAESIIASQSKEIDQMKIWYKDWYGKDLPSGSDVMGAHGMMHNNSGMHIGMMGNTSDMDRLEKAEDFDRVFIEQMIPHHQMAVMMANMLKQGTSRPEMKKLAEDIIKAQTEEIELMRKWYQEWDY